jgi:hypothetical protein
VLDLGGLDMCDRGGGAVMLPLPDDDDDDGHRLRTTSGGHEDGDEAEAEAPLLCALLRAILSPEAALSESLRELDAAIQLDESERLELGLLGRLGEVDDRVGSTLNELVVAEGAVAQNLRVLVLNGWHSRAMKEQIERCFDYDDDDDDDDDDDQHDVPRQADATKSRWVEVDEGGGSGEGGWREYRRQ